MLLVDNAVYSFGEQLSNGIPIPSFKEDPDDIEFKHLMKYLEKCASCEDVREMNRQAFGLADMYKYPFENFIAYYYDMDDINADVEEGETPEIPPGSTGSTGGRAKKLPPKSVDECLEGISSILKQNGGSLIK